MESFNGRYIGSNPDIFNEDALLQYGDDGVMKAQFNNLQLHDMYTHDWVNVVPSDIIIESSVWGNMNKIEYRKGNAVDALLNGEINILLHQTNCLGIWRGGIALELAKRIKDLADKYPTHCVNYFGGFKANSVDLKNASKVSYYNKGGTNYYVGAKALIDKDVKGQFGMVINLYAQRGINATVKETNYAALANSLRSFYNDLSGTLKGHRQREKITIGLPKIGCGLAGGDWNVVEEIINFTFRYFEGKLIVYEL